MTTQDKLADLLRDCLSDYSHPNFTDRRGMADRIRAALQAHAADAARAQAQSSEWVMVPREPTDAMDEAGREAGASAYADADGIRIDALWEAMLAAAPQQAAEPVRQFRVFPKGSTWTEVKDDKIWATVTAHPVSYETRVLYTHPQPAQDASKYQELLMAVEKKFPGESRHETALRYIRQAELRSCEPKCDAAMAKESGR